MEIAVGVYVGRTSARVRDKLWERVVTTCKGGRAVLVYNTNNEQRMDFRIHGETWEPIDFDGLKLMLRPSPARLTAKQAARREGARLGFSNASRYRKGKQRQKATVNHGAEVGKHDFMSSYVVVDIETTGLEPLSDEMIEIGAIKVMDGVVADTFQSFIKIENPIPQNITELTGITDITLAEHGKQLGDVLRSFIEFMGDMPFVAHNAPFDVSFLNHALIKCGFSALTDSAVDTLELTQRLCTNLISYRLKALAVHFELDLPKDGPEELRLHRSLGDCHLTHLLYEKLINLGECLD